MKKSLLPIIICSMLFLGTSVRAAEAVPNFTLTPATGTYGNGSDIVVTVGVDSGTEKVIAADVYGTYDATKLEVVSITAVNDPAINYDASTTGFQPRFYNDTGKFEIPLAPANMNLHDAALAKGPLVTIRFHAKAPGTAAVAFTCTQGDMADSNLTNGEAKDVLDCASNQSGSYTITAAGGDDGSDTTPTPTVSGTLPQTGSVETTIGLLVVGIAGMAGAFLLRWL